MGAIEALPDREGQASRLGVAHMPRDVRVGTKGSVDDADTADSRGAGVHQTQDDQECAVERLQKSRWVGTIENKSDVEEMYQWCANSIFNLTKERMRNLTLMGRWSRQDVELIPKLAEMYEENELLRATLLVERLKRKKLELAYRELL